MSELMTPIPFRELMTWITTEYRRDGAVFGVHKPYKAGVKKLPIFGEAIETPFGPAAGPNTQLAQNIIAGYFAGARFFELKTVQKMDGADLAACINRPCILAEDECYNCEWSTELYVQQAFEEYVKAWCALKIMAKVYGLGDPNGFVFNMSVGYDLAGIQGEKIDTFLNGMVDASKTPIFQECIAVLKEFFPGESDYIDTITPHVSGSVTVSTLHGCPPDEMERIASYLLEKEHLHTFVKCNPTILRVHGLRFDGNGQHFLFAVDLGLYHAASHAGGELLGLYGLLGRIHLLLHLLDAGLHLRLALSAGHLHAAVGKSTACAVSHNWSLLCIT